MITLINMDIYILHLCKASRFHHQAFFWNYVYVYAQKMRYDGFCLNTRVLLVKINLLSNVNLCKAYS